MITSIIMTVMTVQLIDILQENGLALASAIAISALIGKVRWHHGCWIW